MNIQNLIERNGAQWGNFIMNLLTLIIACFIYSFFIINFFIKSYIPGDVLYPDNPCKEPYVTLKESKNPFYKIDPYEEMDAIESQLYSSRYQFCPKDSGEDVINKYNKGKIDSETILFLQNAKQSSKLNLDLMFFETFRSYNKSRAGKVNYHGFPQEAILLLMVSYFKTSVTIKKFFKRMHNILSATDIAQPIMFAIILFITLLGYVYFNLSIDSNKSWNSLILSVCLQITAIIFYVLIFFFFFVFLGMVGISGFINLIYAFLELPVTFCTGIGGFFIGLVVFAFSFFHAGSITFQLFKLFGFWDTFFNTRNRNRIFDFLRKSEYLNYIILILAVLSIILASIHLSPSNAVIWSITLFVYAMYKFFGGTNEANNNNNNNNNKTGNNNKIDEFIGSLKELQKVGLEKNTKNDSDPANKNDSDSANKKK